MDGCSRRTECQVSESPKYLADMHPPSLTLLHQNGWDRDVRDISALGEVVALHTWETCPTLTTFRYPDHNPKYSDETSGSEMCRESLRPNDPPQLTHPPDGPIHQTDATAQLGMCDPTLYLTLLRWSSPNQLAGGHQNQA